MPSVGYRPCLLTLAACLAVGWVAPVPLYAQGNQGVTGLNLLQKHEMAGARLESFRLPGVRGIIVRDRSNPRTEMIILMPTEGQELEPKELGNRFVRNFGLSHYKVAPAKDGSSVVFLISNEAENAWFLRGAAAEEGLKSAESLMPAVNWLNAVTKDSPHALRNGCLIWSGHAPIYAGGTLKDVEISLNLMRPLPCAVELSVARPASGGEDKGIGRLLDMDFDVVRQAGQEARLRKEFGGKPLAHQGNFYLAQVGRGHYRVAQREVLRKMRRSERPEFTLPEVAETPWPDEEAKKRQEAAARAAAEQAAKQAAAQQKAEPSPPAAMPTPAEARDAFIRRLKAL